MSSRLARAPQRDPISKNKNNFKSSESVLLPFLNASLIQFSTLGLSMLTTHSLYSTLLTLPFMASHGHSIESKVLGSILKALRNLAHTQHDPPNMGQPLMTSSYRPHNPLLMLFRNHTSFIGSLDAFGGCLLHPMALCWDPSLGSIPSLPT